MKNSNERQLWCAVLLQAYLDLEAACRTTGRTKDGRYSIICGVDAWDWFHSRERSIGSFRWICDVVGIDQTAVLCAVSRFARKVMRQKRNVSLTSTREL